MLDAHDRRFGQSQLPRGLYPGDPGNDIIIPVDQDRINEAKSLDAPADLSDLGFCITSKLTIRNFEFIERHTGQRQ